MDFSQTSIEHSKYSNQIRISTKPALISAKEQDGPDAPLGKRIV